MRYFLDFDRTLFDSDAYNHYLLEHPACASLRPVFDEVLMAGRESSLMPSPERMELWDRVTELFVSGALTLAPGEVAQFVYPDVPEFLRMVGNDAIIITYGEQTRQRAKVESALAGIPRITALYTGDTMKNVYLEQYPHLVSHDVIFVDDLAAHLEPMGSSFPHMQLFEMRRDGGAGVGTWPVIRSLSELP